MLLNRLASGPLRTKFGEWQVDVFSDGKDEAIVAHWEQSPAAIRYCAAFIRRALRRTIFAAVNAIACSRSKWPWER